MEMKPYLVLAFLNCLKDLKMLKVMNKKDNHQGYVDSFLTTKGLSWVCYKRTNHKRVLH